MKCSIEGCKGGGKRGYYLRGYCNKHYQQVIKYGKTLERTTYDTNEFIVEGGVCHIVLYNQKHKEVGRAIIDTEDKVRCAVHKWHLNHGYVASTLPNRKVLFLHRHILEYNGELEIDHINHSGLDNRKANLRVTTHQQNGMNQQRQKGCSSEYKGVYWFKNAKKWRAQIKANGEKIHLGYFTNELEASEAYNKKAKELFGDYALRHQSITN